MAFLPGKFQLGIPKVPRNHNPQPLPRRFRCHQRRKHQLRPQFEFFAVSCLPKLVFLICRLVYCELFLRKNSWLTSAIYGLLFTGLRLIVCFVGSNFFSSSSSDFLRTSNVMSPRVDSIILRAMSDLCRSPGTSM